MRASLQIFALLTILLASAATLGAQPTFLGHDLSSNRGNALQPNTLQVVTFYDGAQTASLYIRFARQGRTEWIALTDLRNFTNGIDTFEFDLDGWLPTGEFLVRGVRRNGVVDGLAFGLFWTDAQGRYHHLQSEQSSRRTNLVGAWPLGMSHETFAARISQTTDGFGVEQAKMTLYGAALMRTGDYAFEFEPSFQAPPGSRPLPSATRVSAP